MTEHLLKVQFGEWSMVGAEEIQISPFRAAGSPRDLNPRFSSEGPSADAGISGNLG